MGVLVLIAQHQIKIMISNSRQLHQKIKVNTFLNFWQSSFDFDFDFVAASIFMKIFNFLNVYPISITKFVEQ